MIVEYLIVGVALYLLFGDYFAAKAELIRQQAREMEIENDRKEIENEQREGE